MQGDRRPERIHTSQTTPRHVLTANAFYIYTLNQMNCINLQETEVSRSQSAQSDDHRRRL